MDINPFAPLVASLFFILEIICSTYFEELIELLEMPDNYLVYGELCCD